MPYRRQSIPSNARTVGRLVATSTAGDTFTLTWFRSGPARHDRIEWVVQSRRTPTGQRVGRSAEQFTGRRLAAVAGEIDAARAEVRAAGWRITEDTIPALEGANR